MLHYSRDGYQFSADAETLAVNPGSKAITLTLQELAQLGLAFRDNYQIPLRSVDGDSDPIVSIMATLDEAIQRCCREPQDSWIKLNLRRAMILIGGLDEEVTQRILDQEGV